MAAIILQGWLDAEELSCLTQNHQWPMEKKVTSSMCVPHGNHAAWWDRYSNEVGTCVFLPWTGKLSPVPLSTWHGLLCENKGSERMQMNVLKGWFRQRMPTQPSESALLTEHWCVCQTRVQAPSLLDMVGTFWFSLVSLWLIAPLFSDTPLPQLLLSSSLWFSAGLQEVSRLPSVTCFSWRVASV